MKPTLGGVRSITAAATLFAAILALSVGSAMANEVKVTLSGDQEVPPVSTAASGSGSITVGDDMSISGSVTTTGVAATMAHIHLAPTGKNGPVIVHLIKTPAGGWAVPAGAKLTSEQYKSFQAGDLYINVHSDAHDKGELRGQIKP